MRMPLLQQRVLFVPERQVQRLCMERGRQVRQPEAGADGVTVIVIIISFFIFFNTLVPMKLSDIK